MPKVTPSDDFRIAAMDSKKKDQAVNLMTVGSGMPWEDRGSDGVVAGFFRTLFRAMVQPSALLAQMRRPETSRDATAFAIGCCVFWFFGSIIQSIFDYVVTYHRDPEIPMNSYILNTVLIAAASGAGAFLMLKIAAIIFHKMTKHDMASKAPPVLVYNVLAYLMAPSIFALIPGNISIIPIGPTLAMIWMLLLWIAAGISRLKIPTGGAIIASVLTMGACAAMVFAGYLVINVVAGKLLAMGIPDSVKAAKSAAP